MTDHIGERACQLAVYMIENRATVRAAAKKFGISKSTVHKDLSQRLPQYNQALYEQVKVILDTNKAQRHIRGALPPEKSTRESKTGAVRGRRSGGSHGGLSPTFCLFSGIAHERYRKQSLHFVIFHI